MRVIEEPTGLKSWKLKLEAKEGGMARVAIVGPGGGEKSFVVIPANDLVSAARAVYQEAQKQDKCKWIGTTLQSSLLWDPAEEGEASWLFQPMTRSWRQTPSNKKPRNRKSVNG